ncbi:MAG: glycosyltransferase family 1 protein [Candidatus Schekmanbacteria bacterium]|nr:MAG: glycosyltransferase family 1 protein [Candidatus Schekmanbacteria bacterium]
MNLINNSSAKGLKIAFVHSKYSTVGGTEKYLFRITKELSKRGACVDYYTSKIETEPIKGIHIHKIGAIKKPASAFLLSFLLTSSSALKNKKYDIIQSSGKTIPANIYRLGGGLHNDYISNKGGGISSFSFHSLMVRLIEKNIFSRKKFRKLIAPSKRIKSLLVRKYFIEEEKIEVLYNPILIDIVSEEERQKRRKSFRSAHNIGEDSLCYLFAAGNFSLKGLKELINAYSFLPDEIKNKSYVIVAGGGNKKRYLSLLKERKIEDRFIFLGKITDEMQDIYSSGDILVHPTHYDPFSNVCLEAMAYGIPVITTAINGFSEIIENGSEGYVVSKPDDIVEISNLMNELAKDEIRKEMSKRCKSKSGNFDIDKHMNCLINIYNEVKD